MNEVRAAFNPCKFSGYIYVCGSGSQTMEAFALQTDQFLPLQFSLPELRGCCMFVQNNMLVVHSAHYTTRLAAGEAGQLVPRAKVHLQSEHRKAPNSQPVLDPARNLFFVLQFGKCFCFNMHHLPANSSET